MLRKALRLTARYAHDMQHLFLIHEVIEGLSGSMTASHSSEHNDGKQIT